MLDDGIIPIIAIIAILIVLQPILKILAIIIGFILLIFIGSGILYAHFKGGKNNSNNDNKK